MRYLLLFLLAWGPVACEENVDPATPEGSLHLFRDALMAKDTPAILSACSKQTHATLAELHTLLKEQRAAITTHYPEDHVPAARTAYSDGVLDAPDSAALFAALLAEELAALEATPGLKYGMSALGAATIDGDRATVPTQSGETVELVKEGDRWKITAFERPVEQNLNRVKLNQQTLTENLKVFQELRDREKRKKAKEAAQGPGEGADAGAGGE